MIMMALLVPVYATLVIPLAVLMSKFKIKSVLLYMISGVFVGSFTIAFYSFLSAAVQSMTFEDHIVANLQDAKVLASIVVGGGIAGYFYRRLLPERMFTNGR